MLNGKVPAERLRGRIAVVGATAPSLQDVHATSTTAEELMSGPEFQANAIETVLEDFPVRETSPAVDVLIILLMSFIAPLAAARFPLLPAVLMSLLTAAAYFGLTILLFESGTVLPFVFPLFGLGLSPRGLTRRVLRDRGATRRSARARSSGGS